MRPTPNYERFPMLNGAWNAATTVVDDVENLRGDPQEAELNFLKRKCCQGLVKEDCRTAFNTAVQIAQTAIRFRRAKCGTLPPKASKRYELLLSLAIELETKFPTSDVYLLTAGCRLVEMYWDR